MPTLEIKALILLASNIEEDRCQKKLDYEILAKEANLFWVTSSKLLEDIKESISNHPQLDKLVITNISVHTSNFHIESTDLPNQVFAFTLSGTVDVYHKLYETEDG